VTWLIGVTGDPLAPAWYVIATSVVGVAAMLATPETKPAIQIRQQGSLAGHPDCRKTPVFRHLSVTSRMAGDPLAPAWYVIATSVVGVAAMLATPETKAMALAAYERPALRTLRGSSSGIATRLAAALMALRAASSADMPSSG
jgi:nicotinate-nucleotide pyrophosphorylase